MTLSTTVSRVDYLGSNTTGPFAVPFRFFLDADLLVVKRDALGAETVLTLTTDYSVSGAGNATGSITLVTALATGEVLSILRAPGLVQTTSLRNGGTYYGATHEDEFDRMAMRLQRLEEAIKRSFGLTDSYNPGAMLVRVKPETGKVLAWQSSTELGNSTLDSSAVALPGQGRTVATLSAYLANNAVFNVLDYGALGDGSHDDTADIQAALTAAAALSRPAVVVFPVGYTFLVTSTLTIAADGVQLVGGMAGRRNAVIQFQPATDDELFYWKKADGSVLYQAGIRHLMLSGAGTAVKTALHLYNCSEFTCEDVHIFAFNDATCSSVGVHMEGRELCRWRDFTIRADRAFWVSVNPEGGAIHVDFDHQSFEDCYFASEAGNTNTCFLIDPDVVVTNLKADGFALVGYKHGIYWDATPAINTSAVIAIRNFRAEEATDATGWTIYLGGASGSIRQFRIEDALLDSGRNGMRLRNIQQVTIDSVSYDSTSLVAWDIDSSCLNVVTRNWIAQAGSTASIAAGLLVLMQGPRRFSTSPFPPDATYQSTAVTEAPRIQVGDLTANGTGLNSAAGLQLSVPTGTATTLATLPNVQATYLVTCALRNSPSTTAYGAALIVCTGGGVFTVITLGSGIYTFTTTGAGLLQVTQSSGGPLDTDWTIARFAYSRI